MTHLEAAVAAAFEPLDTPPLLAVSGGRDSMAMLHACRVSGAVVTYVDHRLDDDSAVWGAFVEAAAADRKYPFEAALAHTADVSEAALRTARYEALTTVVERRGLRAIALAHTADDQAETVLHRVLRGTGLAGLTGIPVDRDRSGIRIVRPLLSITRAEVTAYLRQHGVRWVDDPSNATADYTRNWLRNDLLPSVRERVNPDVDGALLRLAENAGEAATLIERFAADLLSQARGVAGRLDCRVLRDAEPLLRREALRAYWRDRGWPQRAMTRRRWQDAAAVIEADGPVACDLPGGIRLRRSGGVLIFETTGPA